MIRQAFQTHETGSKPITASVQQTDRDGDEVFEDWFEEVGKVFKLDGVEWDAETGRFDLTFSPGNGIAWVETRPAKFWRSPKQWLKDWMAKLFGPKAEPDMEQWTTIFDRLKMVRSLLLSIREMATNGECIHDVLWQPGIPSAVHVTVAESLAGIASCLGADDEDIEAAFQGAFASEVPDGSTGGEAFEPVERPPQAGKQASSSARSARQQRSRETRPRTQSRTTGKAARNEEV